MPMLIVAGLGTSQVRFDPPITQTSSTVGVHGQVVFTPAVQCSDAPLRLLISAQFDGNYEAECTGSISNANVHGTLHWSDGTTSAFALSAPTAAERVQGHGIGHCPGTITSGYYRGARIDILWLGFAADAAACLSGRSVSGTTGANVISVTTA